MNNIKLCDKCKAVDVKKIQNELSNIDKEIKYEIGCLSFCGIGRTRPFAIVNNTPIITDNTDELIEKIKEVLK